MNSLTSVVAAVLTDDAGRVLLCRQGGHRRRWGLPGGRIRRAESPVQAAVRDIRSETGLETEIVDLVGLYQLSGGCDQEPPGAGQPVPPPDVLVYVFRGRVRQDGDPVGAARATCRLSWHDPADLPGPMTPTTRTAISDAVAGRAGVLRSVRRDPDPESANSEPAEVEWPVAGDAAPAPRSGSRHDGQPTPVTRADDLAGH
ncbi:MAG TPA: NUDIX hydrolase [Micromonospora sp.]